MRIIRKKVISDHIEEIEVENSILGFKSRKVYRRIYGGNILRYRHPDDYTDTDLGEYIRMKPMFNIPNEGLTPQP